VSVTVAGREATLGEVAHLEATTHLSARIVGTPESVADEMQDRVESECCDGFTVSHALSPGSLSRFVELVVPELQRRGIFRKEYTGRTFRENLQN
jgi:alkanesulfonate monooxygenase SsuD/methylene tetrahydromethanopterin reductase-like flavin-dependent oxidoreductase (luciferase family)